MPRKFASVPNHCFINHNMQSMLSEVCKIKIF